MPFKAKRIGERSPSPSRRKDLGKLNPQDEEVKLDKEPRRIAYESEAAFFKDPRQPPLELPNHSLAWPLGEPEWMKASASFEARASAQQAWASKLRVIMPDSCGAASSARREALWQRLVASVGYDEELRAPENIPLDDLVNLIEKLMQQCGLVERRQLGMPTPQPIQFLQAGMRAAADETGLERRSFRVLLMRLHPVSYTHLTLPTICSV